MDEFEQNRILNMLNDGDSDCSDELGIGEENISETEYNSTKGAVDTVDEMCWRYNTGRSCKRWPLAIFLHMLNISGINSQIIYTG